ncbi:NlpC/P60 family protein [Micromonospora sp. MED01]|uniref:C40 family peptidase n=1 Tax=Micromonospora alfalfae TaxID=2911212 RepID=UPI001EE84103|nr:C40 family peptidase [Micromonospora alfalfae]MCG5466608.1 NlpC/P60 family protein [Micromonospora alfalfae]
MRNGLAAVAVVVALGVFTPFASPALAVPSPAEVEKQLDQAWEKLEPVIEQYNKVHSELLANQRKSKELRERLEPVQLRVEMSLGQIGDMAARQYRIPRASAVNAVLASKSPEMATDRLALLNYVARSDAAKIADVVKLRDDLVAQRAQVEALVVKQKRLDAELVQRRKVIQAEVDRLEGLRPRAAAGGGSSGGSLRIGACPAVNIGGAAGTAVRTACAQIGKPYVWGAGGPSSFDCSGLTQYAWKAAGVSLTHFTGAQWREGTSIARADLRPGDLVFFYSDLHHVGMYVGNGLIVHASRAGVPVKMARMDTMPYMGGRRP